MHSLLDRRTILAGLSDELRPLLPSLGGALGDLCAGLGQAEAAGQALETAFIIRAAAEMLELEELAEAGSLVEAVVPLLNGAPPSLLREGLPVVQALMSALELAGESLVEGVNPSLRSGPREALETARSGIERLRLGRSELEPDRVRSAPGLEEMLATLENVPARGGFVRPDESPPEPTIWPDAPVQAETAAEPLIPSAAADNDAVDGPIAVPGPSDLPSELDRPMSGPEREECPGGATPELAPPSESSWVIPTFLQPVEQQSERLSATTSPPIGSSTARPAEAERAMTLQEVPARQEVGFFSRFLDGLRGQPVASDSPPAAAPQAAPSVSAEAWPPSGGPAEPIVPPARAESASGPSDGRLTVSHVDAEILEVFQAEAADVLADLGRHLAAVRDDPAERQAAAEMRRACHTLKGAANVVGFPSIGLLCKSMEDLLDALAEAETAPDEAALGFLQAGHETLEQLAPNPGETSLVGRVAELSAIGAELALRVGMPTESAEPDPSTPEGAAWASAVDRFLADVPAVADESLTSADSPNQRAEYPSVLGDQGPPHDAGGGPAEEAHNAELIAVFVLEAEEHVSALSGAALRLDLNSDDAEALAEAHRALHTLKGSASALGHDTIGSLCHEAESRLQCEDPTTWARLLFEVAELLEQHVRALAATGKDGAAATAGPLSLPEATFLAPDPPEHSSSGETAARPIEAPMEGEQEIPSTSGAVRVELNRVDELLNLVGEVVLTRSNLVQRVERVGRAAEELRLTVARLRRVAQYLEDRYEVAELIRTAPDEPRHGDFDELEMDRYTELHRVSREITELAADAETTSDDLDLALKELDGLTGRQARLGNELQDKLVAMRLVPLSSLANRLHRTARSVALKQGKDIEFVLQGGRTELDKRVLEELGDVLLHLIRNAVDHGLESPEERRRLGKPVVGTLRMSASREGSEAVIQLADDGAGVDLGRLRQRAEAAGLLSSGQKVDKQDLLDLIFRPGISTSAVASDVSGRGVGLDVVRTTVARLKGSVDVSSEAGHGTTFTLRLPVILAVVQAMLVRAGEESYAIPMAALERVMRTAARPVMSLGRTPVIELDGETMPFLELRSMLGLESADRSEEETPLLVVRTGERRVALAVDGVLGQQEVVVKTLGPHLRSVRGVLGGSVQSNGKVLLVINTTELLSARVLMVSHSPEQTPPAALLDSQLSALVVDDSLSVRKVLARTLERDGWQVRQARDGVDALDILQSFRPQVILMDIEMPRMDGFELTRILNDVADYGNPAVVMLTSRAGDKHRKRAEELGVAGYVVKPYQETELLAALRQVALAGPKG